MKRERGNGGGSEKRLPVTNEKLQKERKSKRSVREFQGERTQLPRKKGREDTTVVHSCTRQKKDFLTRKKCKNQRKMPGGELSDGKGYNERCRGRIRGGIDRKSRIMVFQRQMSSAVCRRKKGKRERGET